MLSDVGLALLILYIFVLASVIITELVFLIKTNISLWKNKNSFTKRYYILFVFSVVISMISFVFNMGWLRFILLFLAVPVIYPFIFLIINNISLTYIEKSVKLKKYIVFSNITFVLGHLLLPDGGDIGPSYMFFGLIKNDIFAKIVYLVSFLLIVANIVITILQIIEVKKAKKALEV